MFQVVKKISTYFIVILLSLYTLVWFLSPYVFPYIINDALAPYKLVLDEESSISYNPLTAHIDIDDLIVYTVQDEISDGEKEKVFALKDLEFEVRLYQFLFDDIYISELYIDGLYINITQGPEHLFIAGINISGNSTSESNTHDVIHSEGNAKENAALKSIEAKQEEPQSSDVIPYTLYLPDVEIKSSHVNLVVEDESHTVHFKAFTMTDMELSLDKHLLDLTIESEIDDAAFNLELKGDFEDAQGEFLIDLDVQKYQLSRIAKHVGLASKGLKGEVSYAASHTITYNEGTFGVEVPKIQFLLSDAVYQEGEHQFELEAANLDLTKLAVNFSDLTEVDLTGKGQFKLSSFNALDITNKDVVANLTSLLVNNINLQSIKSQPQIDIENITFDTFKFSQTQLPETPALASFKQLLLEHLLITDTSISVDDISLSGINVDAHINEDKKLINLIDALQSKPPGEDPTQSELVQGEEPQERDIQESTVPEDAAIDETVQAEQAEIKVQPASETLEAQMPPAGVIPAKAFAIKVNSFSISDDAHISFWDESVTPHYKREIIINTVTMGVLDSENPDIETPIVIKGSSDKYATFNADVFAKPFLVDPEFRFDTKVNEVSLPGVSPYLVEALGHEIISGQLDLDIKGDLKGPIIDSDVGILLRGIELQGAEDDDEHAEEATSTGVVNTEKNSSKSVASDAENEVKNEGNNMSVIPFNIALNYLKDGDGNVDLSLPVSGDVNDPSFGLSGFITIILKKSVISAAREYLVTAVVPYAQVVNIAISAVGDDVLKVSINPLPYAAKQVDIGEQQQVFTSQFSALLKEKSDIYIKMCAVVIPEDIDQARTAKLTKDERKALMTLAKERANKFKDHMVDEEGISSARILLCKPSINQDEDAISELVFTH